MIRRVLLVSLFAAVPMLGQEPAPAAAPTTAATKPSTELPPLPKEPEAILAAAAPLYDFSSPALKPWHMKVSYELYDNKDKPSGEGSYEYWWAAPDTYRSTWMKAGLEHTDWVVHGVHFDRYTWSQLGYAEREIETALLHPLPIGKETDRSQFFPEREKLGKEALSCVTVVPASMGKLRDKPPPGLFPIGCFDKDSSVLRLSQMFVETRAVFGDPVRLQGKVLPRSIVIAEGEHLLLTAKVYVLEEILSDTPEFNPAPEAVKEPFVNDHKPGKGATPPIVTHSAEATFPLNSKIDGGIAIIRFIVGTDGMAHELTPVSGPSLELLVQAMSAIHQYRFKPAMKMGSPIEAEMSIEINFRHY